MGFLALEGGVCSGKSTVSRELAGREIFRIPEYMELIPSSHPAHSTLPVAEDRVRLFVELERERMKLIPSVRPPHLVADRCAITWVAFEIAVSAIGHEAALSKMACLTETYVHLPDSVMIIAISDAQRRERWRERQLPQDSVFVGERFNEALGSALRRAQALTALHSVDASVASVDDLVSFAVGVLGKLPSHSPIRAIPLSELVAAMK